MRTRRATQRPAKSSGQRTRTTTRPTPGCGSRAPPRATRLPRPPSLLCLLFCLYLGDKRISCSILRDGPCDACAFTVPVLHTPRTWSMRLHRRSLSHGSCCRAKEQQEASSIAEAAAADNIASTTQPKDPGKRPNGVAPGRAEHKQAAGHRSSEPDAPPVSKKGAHVCQACHKHHRSAPVNDGPSEPDVQHTCCQ